MNTISRLRRSRAHTDGSSPLLPASRTRSWRAISAGQCLTITYCLRRFPTARTFRNAFCAPLARDASIAPGGRSGDRSPQKPPPRFDMERMTRRSAALCASLALAGCSREENSSPAEGIDASSGAGAPGAGSSSGSGGAGGRATGGAEGGSGKAGGPAGGSSGGSTVRASDASGMGEDVAPATRDDATTDAADVRGECAGLFCEDFELGQFDSAKWNVQMAGGSTVAIEQEVVAHGSHAAHFHSLGTPSGGAAQAYIYLLTKSVPSALRVHNF